MTMLNHFDLKTISESLLFESKEIEGLGLEDTLAVFFGIKNQSLI